MAGFDLAGRRVWVAGHRGMVGSARCRRWAAENCEVLNSGPREYSPGTLLGGVLPPCTVVCPVFKSGITVHATSWAFTATAFDVSFALSAFIKSSGPGVYTIYSITGNDTSMSLTSISVFVR